ncbi:hypothetical protein Gasu_57320 isoform 2 [Galdieria sulphuraria]|nr:hypothetical protein Gasu_57320 isoform 2 [Galdieria sulphuraria]EME26608.1 hypothetical protein isoform 2 [Galdieria sulphuraria]|eukprot:XP_005703128.1 hypothetical protein isoform 2 [Galdieria sulphuraria]
MNDKGVILAFDDNQLYVAYWNAITIIVVHFGQKARLLPPNEYFKNNWSLAKTHQIQVTRINLQPQDEYVVVASDSLLQYLTLEGIMRMINRLLRKNVPIQSIAESLVNAACSLGYRGELALHLILLRKPEWNLDVCVHGGNIYNTLRGYLPHCSQDYFSSGVSSASESTKTTSHRDKISVNSLYERKIVSDDSVLSSTPYYPSTSREEPKKDLQSEDRKDSSTFCHSKEDVEDSLLQLIKGNSHVVS